MSSSLFGFGSCCCEVLLSAAAIGGYGRQERVFRIETLTKRRLCLPPCDGWDLKGYIGPSPKAETVSSEFDGLPTLVLKSIEDMKQPTFVFARKGPTSILFRLIVLLIGASDG